MITPEEFIKQWTKGEDAVLKFNTEQFEKIKIKEETKNFLISGIPEEASPFLSFGNASGEGTVETIAQSYNLDKSFERYLIIGFDGSGNPICIDNQENDRMVMLNHDQGFRAVFMNSTINQFAEILLAYRDYSMNKKPVDFIKKKVSEIDTNALSDNTKLDEDNYWKQILKNED